MLALGICPLCKQDVNKHARTLDISRSEGMTRHMEAHGKKALGELVMALDKDKDKLPPPVRVAYASLVCAELLIEEIKIVFTSKRITVSLAQGDGVYDYVKDCIVHMDPSAIFEEDYTPVGAMEVMTWMSPEEIAGITGVSKTEAGGG